MKKMITCVVFTLLVFTSSVQAAWSEYSTISSVKVMGEKWHNDNRGGFLFYLNDSPSGVSYFIVRPTDVSLKLFLSEVMHAMALDRQIQVRYNHVNGSEGDVVSIDYK